MDEESRKSTVRVAVSAALGGLAGSLLGTSWLLLEFLPEIFHSLDTSTFAAMLVGPPMLIGFLIGFLPRTVSGSRHFRFIFLVAAIPALLCGILVASWWFQWLANA